MRLQVLALLAAACVFTGCQSSSGTVYTGTLPEDASAIRGPSATGTSRTHEARREAAKARSNEVDIPVYEFAHVRCESVGYGRFAVERYDARKGTLGLESRRATDMLRRGLTESHSVHRQLATDLDLNQVTTKFRGADGRRYVLHRHSSDGAKALSMDNRTWQEGREFDTTAHKMRRGLSAARTADELRADSSRQGLEQMFGERVIGLQLWKYADRDVAANDVVITYTLVYYNTNTYDTGPTEISEPVPLLTEYVEKSATLPKEGVSVELLRRADGSQILRWSFPKGIKAGETNKMTYKVRVKLEREYRPGGAENPPEPEHP